MRVTLAKQIALSLTGKEERISMGSAPVILKVERQKERRPTRMTFIFTCGRI